MSEGVRIAGTGSYLPGRPLDWDDVRTFLRRYPDTLPESVQERLLVESGIETRHYGIDVTDESRRVTNTKMATEVGRRALAAAGWTPNDVDLLIVTTVVPDQLMPPTSTLVQEALGIASCAELEISANCTAPTKALMVAAGQLKLGAYRRALVCFSQFASFGFIPPWTNPERMGRGQAHLRWILSDGAAAVALERGGPDIDLRVFLQSRGVGKKSGMSIALGAAYPDLRKLHAAGSHHATQEAARVLKEAVDLACEGLEAMLLEFKTPGEAIDHFIPSVNSARVVETVIPRISALGIRESVWRLNFTRVGYVGSVAVPIMLDELARDGRLRPGDVVCTMAEESSKWMFAGTLFRWNP